MESLSSSKNILILLSPQLSKNIIYLVTALGTILAKNGKNVSILLESKQDEKSNDYAIEKIIKDRKILNVNLIEKIQPKRTVITVNKGNAKIKNVLWKEDQDKLLFQIESVADNFEIKEVDFKTTGTEADTIIFVGCKEINDLANVYSVNPSLFTNAFSINIDNSKDNLRFAKSNYVIEGETYTKVFMNFIKENILSISSSEATLFLLTLLLETKVFTLGLERSEGTFELVVELIKAGASYSEALNNYNSLNSTRNIPTGVKQFPNVNQPIVSFSKAPNQFVQTQKPTLSSTVKPQTDNSINKVTSTVNAKDLGNLDILFPKAGTQNEPTAVKIDQTQTNTPLFTPYSSAPNFNSKPVYKQYQGFVPNNPNASSVGKK